LQILLFTQLGFFLLLKKLWCENTISLDTDWFPRKSARALMWFTNKPLASIEYNFIGEIYEFIIQKPILRVAKFFKTIDTVVIDGSFSAIGDFALAWSRKMQDAQTGQVQHYAMLIVAGVIAVIIFVMVMP
jgi:multicomponent Na+:H+ antiporter subunit D